MRKSQNSVIRFQNKLSVRALQPGCSLLIYDQRLKKHPQIKKLIQKFPLRYPVKAGESLKDIQKFPAHVTKILKLLQNHNQKDLQIVGLGGGSVVANSRVVCALIGVNRLHNCRICGCDGSGVDCRGVGHKQAGFE